MRAKMGVPQLLVLAGGGSVLLRRLMPQHSSGLGADLVFLFLALALANFLSKVWIYQPLIGPLRHIPTPPGRNILLGETFRILRDPTGMPAREWIRTVPNQGMIRYSIWGQERLLVTSPEAFGEVLVKRNYDFVKPDHLRRTLSRLLGVGILLAEGDEHKRQRKTLMPAFAFRHVKDLYSVFWGKAKELTECLSAASSAAPDVTQEKGDYPKTSSGASDHAPGVVPVTEWASRATLDIIGLAGMGQDFDSLHNDKNELNITYRKVFGPSRAAIILQFLTLLIPSWIVSRLPVKRNSDIAEAAGFISQKCRELVAQKRKSMLEKERVEVDILSVAIESGGFSDEELVNQMMTFLAAGHETTATAMTWAIFELCRHPEIQSRLRAEVRARLPSPDADINADDIDGLDYLQAVCSETLRLWSPISITLRAACCDTSILGQFVPKGTPVILSPWATNADTRLWGADADEFVPERWLDRDGRANKNGGAESNFSSLTFLHGPRSCIGQKFAVAEFKCLLAAWVGRFQMEFEEGSPLTRPGMPEIVGGITAKPKGGLWVKMGEISGW